VLTQQLEEPIIERVQSNNQKVRKKDRDAGYTYKKICLIIDAG
jgi:hypothetical protein